MIVIGWVIFAAGVWHLATLVERGLRWVCGRIERRGRAIRRPASEVPLPPPLMLHFSDGTHVVLGNHEAGRLGMAHLILYRRRRFHGEERPRA